ncbi:unnamed protein product [Blepharisma stoltei]|uniref:LITAF domain-containing protein n=1 Tax=Blepharisma stoltei TaxID=1481888 RepID=A0AAU9JUD9_9CILI|nr:unnamed protein product [Blepharisma stoltei]
MSSSEKTPLKAQYPPPYYIKSENYQATPPPPQPMPSNHDNSQDNQTPLYYEFYDPYMGLGNTTQNIYCQICGRNTWTRVEQRPGLLSYLCCTYLCLSGCFCGCCLIPLYSKHCKDSVHFCSNCNTPLAVVTPL